MNATRMTSSSAGTTGGEGTNVHTFDPTASFRAATRRARDASRSVPTPTATGFSISSRATTSAPRALIADTIFASWAAKASREYAPRTLHFLVVTKAPVRSG